MVTAQRNTRPRPAAPRGRTLENVLWLARVRLATWRGYKGTRGSTKKRSTREKGTLDALMGKVRLGKVPDMRLASVLHTRKSWRAPGKGPVHRYIHFSYTPKKSRSDPKRHGPVAPPLATVTTPA